MIKKRLDSYGVNRTRQKGEPEYRKDADLGEKAHWAVIKIMIRRLRDISMI